MKILVVMTHSPFLPRAGSTIVAYNSMKHLAKRHTMDLICLKPVEDSASVEFVRHVEWVPAEKTSKIVRWLRYVRGMLIGVPYVIAAVASRQMEVKVAAAASSGAYECLLLFEMSAMQYCPPAAYSKIVAHIEDPQSLRLSRLRTLSTFSLSQKMRFYLLEKLMARYERRILPKIAKVLLLSLADMRDMRQQGNYTNLSCVPYGVECNAREAIIGYEAREKAILFSGNMYHPANVDGALWLLDAVFPHVIKQSPNSVLWIVGSSPDERIVKAAAKFDKQVLITGRVDDITDYIRRACVSVCPVRLKIGVQTKVLEALALGTPVVTTSAGNSGIVAASGSQLWVEDEPERFAGRVCELLQGREWNALSEAGRKLAAEQFSWEDSASKLEQYMESLNVHGSNFS